MYQQQQYGNHPHPPPPGAGPHGPPPPGAGPYAGPPPHGGHGPYGPAPAYGPAPGMQPNLLTDLNNQATVWLIVAVAGFWVGAGWISGPLAWIYGGRLRNRYRMLGLVPSSTATGAWAIGIATTLLMALGIVTALFLITFVFGTLAIL